MALQRHRAIGIFFPSKMTESGFRSKSKMITISAWLLALLPMVPGAFKKFGRYGLECKTRKCTVINMGEDLNPTSVNPKRELGRWSPVVAGTLLLVLNAAIYLRLRVKRLSWSNRTYLMNIKGYVMYSNIISNFVSTLFRTILKGCLPRWIRRTCPNITNWWQRKNNLERC